MKTSKKARSSAPRPTAAATDYAHGVLGGSIPACKWVKLAAQRHLDDLLRSKSGDWPYRFDTGKAEHICDFIHCFPNIKGKWGGKPLELQGWQKFILCNVFGWVRKESGLRRFRTAYLEMPRKQGKSTLSSGVGLFALTADGEMGAEVYSAATTRDQARIVFADAQQMARRTPDFREHYGVQVNAHNINIVSAGSKFEALSSEADSLDGLNVHCAIIDELHAHKTREVWDVIETATGSRTQPLIWTITTAGSNRAGICYEQRDYVCKILQRVVEDDTYFGIIYTIDDDDDWTSPDAWRKANPNFEVSVHPDDIERKARKAMQIPSAQNNFLTKHLSVWVSSDAGLFDMAAWEKSADPSLSIEQFRELPCWIGIDLGFVDDIAAMVLLFQRDHEFVVFGRYYLPEETIEESRNSQYSGWHRSGRITATDGNITDIEAIVDDLDGYLRDYNVQQVVYDPYNKLTLLNTMQKKGVSDERLVEYPQTVAMMSPPTEKLMQLVRARKVKHDGDPVLSWAMSNVVGHFDAKDNVYPRKERPENKIDPAIALTMALGMALRNENGPSVYETRGILTIN